MAGASQVISSSQYGVPTTMQSTSMFPRLMREPILPIRSITINNQSSATTAVVYLGQGANGPAAFGVPPGGVMTQPIMPSTSISVLPVIKAGNAADGAIFVHIDSEPMSASGFQQATTSPVWIWDESAWDGGAAWST